MYLEPEMEVVNLKLEGMLCTSGEGGDMDPDTGEAESGDGSNPGNPWG